MADDVDVVDITKPTDDAHIESQIQQWLTDNPNATIDQIVKVSEKSGRVKLAIVHTDA